MITVKLLKADTPGNNGVSYTKECIEKMIEEFKTNRLKSKISTLLYKSTLNNLEHYNYLNNASAIIKDIRLDEEGYLVIDCEPLDTPKRLLGIDDVTPITMVDDSGFDEKNKVVTEGKIKDFVAIDKGTA